ncbi:DUF3619 family protein [Variovorax ginsengisoli]|uniref:DUF3619 family protein n=1 Tax=Variovorax ginsengisoli TaxID=363844 RepID=A0ABT9SEA6_9BURK|nr:DUF3619 family protein [Variovorax ginsengisoli]MDP9902118.1 hypothetical protein [Variovorax ginsengisoli]
MKTSHSDSGSALEARFGRSLAARLSEGNAELPHDIGERLRVARAQALAKRKMAPQMRPAVTAHVSNDTVTLGGGWWTRIGAVVPLVALVAGLVAISVVQEDNRASEVADVDSALLTGDLPPAAYTDPGFVQFLKSEAETPR